MPTPAEHINPEHIESGRWHVHGKDGHCHSISGGYALHQHKGVGGGAMSRKYGEAPRKRKA